MTTPVSRSEEFGVRLMTLDETDLVLDYFLNSTPEHLELLGVDPTRVPSRSSWSRVMREQLAAPIEQRSNVFVIWRRGGRAIGFSSVDHIVFGDQANMHLHVTEADERAHGYGVECVRRSVDVYFECLQLRRLFCEPSALNVAPNRTLQRAGFKYVKTHMTVPGPLNYHQAVTRWVIER